MKVPHNYISEHRTECMIMRPLTVKHIAPWIGFLRDKTAIRYFPERGLNPDESAKHWIESQLLRYADGRFGLMSLHLGDGTFIGQCGLITQEIDGEKVLEIGYHLFPDYWGKGYASEAAIYFRKFAFENGITDQVVSIIHTENELSQAVAGRNGMKLWKHSSWNGKDVVVFAVSKSESL